MRSGDRKDTVATRMASTVLNLEGDEGEFLGGGKEG